MPHCAGIRIFWLEIQKLKNFVRFGADFVHMGCIQQSQRNLCMICYKILLFMAFLRILIPHQEFLVIQVSKLASSDEYEIIYQYAAP